MHPLYDHLLQEARTKLNSVFPNPIVKIKAKVTVFPTDEEGLINYRIMWEFHKLSANDLYIEEKCENRSAQIVNNTVIKEFYNDEKTNINPLPIYIEQANNFSPSNSTRKKKTYYRQKAVQYAEIWWNSYNQKYPHFANDCTNYISQCLQAGGFPLEQTNSKTKGWWCKKKQWSYSWAVSHSLQLYLSGSPLTRIVDSVEMLFYGDLIFYDFEGDGRFNHTTIITGKDAEGTPLVNAHSTNSRQRYWDYTDSSAYSSNTTYKFLHIVDENN